MGAWGAALYADDTTCEVRDAYVENLKHGLSDTEAYERILNGYGDTLDDREVACLVYFGLADTAWKFGRLDAAVKVRALELLAQGGDLFVWERDAPEEAAARNRALSSLEARLLTEQPAPKPVKISKPKPKKIRTTAPVGTVFTRTLPSGYKAIFVLVGFYDDGKSVDPVFSVLRWRGHHVPSDSELREAAASPLQFSSGLGLMPHVGIFPQGRTSVMAGFEETEWSIGIEMPYDPYRAVFTFVERIAEDIDASFELPA
jgi:hypothetical protein